MIPLAILAAIAAGIWYVSRDDDEPPGSATVPEPEPPPSIGPGSDRVTLERELVTVAASPATDPQPEPPALVAPVSEVRKPDVPPEGLTANQLALRADLLAGRTRGRPEGPAYGRAYYAAVGLLPPGLPTTDPDDRDEKEPNR